MPPLRRFPPPWTVEDIGAAFVVTDSAGQKLAYVYFDDEPGRMIKLKEWRANHITLRNCCYSRRYGGPGARTFR
jgi:hypothetical protein